MGKWNQHMIYLDILSGSVIMLQTAILNDQSFHVLTLCGLVTPYDVNSGSVQEIACCLKAPLPGPVLTCNQFLKSSFQIKIRSCGVHSRMLFTWRINPQDCLKLTYLKSQPQLPEDNELICCLYHKSSNIWQLFHKRLMVSNCALCNIMDFF